ncbi:2-keto-4-pentenoate hydratase [Marinihelvus fidelis]|uniref:2-keto-4-pentenoate hydratase n=1 Tax=Marinihelvus fidelis TaxID=2613842 RepID=A0A5N0T9Q2_9GAMM|nr:2-keto-4-pentenoate hydratase [Marinihelvus fidelis]KAA9131682.1 2-keto-4-pentenoate hydratase [Marinihelvus fidelis]
MTIANDIGGIASSFVSARQNARALEGYPGEIPADIDTSYRIQDQAIELWPDRVVGWKVGGLNAENTARFGVSRLVGPIFASDVWAANGDTPVPFPVFDGGFAAVEAELVLVLGEDAPADKLSWTSEEAAALVSRVHMGIETAGSPLATINELGPTVIISDFGNNHGLILGAEIPGGVNVLDEGMHCSTTIDGENAGSNNIPVRPEGPLESLRVLLEVNARRGRPLKAGDLVSSGAQTGIHDVSAGQSAVSTFGDYGSIHCVATPAKDGQG